MHARPDKESRSKQEQSAVAGAPKNGQTSSLATAITDNRPESAAQRKALQLMNSNPDTSENENTTHASVPTKTEVVDSTSVENDGDGESESTTTLASNSDIEEEQGSEKVVEKTQPVALGKDQHNIHIFFTPEEVVTEVHSTTRQLDAMITYLRTNVNALYLGPMNLLIGRYNRIKANYLRLSRVRTRDIQERGRLRSIINSPYGRPDKVRVAKQQMKVQRQTIRDSSHDVTEAEAEVEREARAVIVNLWDRYANVLALYLMPGSVLTRELPVVGGLDPDDYFTGASPTTAIPIIWYKPRAGYPNMKDRHGNTKTMTQGADIGGGVTISSQWPITNLRKVSHDGDRSQQTAFNQLINTTANVAVIEGASGLSLPSPMGQGPLQGYDGDHVKDLGFNGNDARDNYWPLPAHINRRAFTGYNQNYRVHYREGDEVKMKAIGGLIGKYFTIKGYMGTGGGSVPAESGTTNAGKA